MTTNGDSVLIAQRARAASHVLGSAASEMKDVCLKEALRLLRESRDKILQSNAEDLRAASAAVGEGDKGSYAAGILSRLSLQDGKLDSATTGLEELIWKVEDPVGKVLLARRLDEGLELYRVACPIGVLCVIFEARPEAVIQIASLAIKSGNALILKGGKEAARSNAALAEVFRKALVLAGLPEDAVQLVSSREEISELLSLHEYIDLVIPRGSKQLVMNIKENTKIPVMGHADGICSVFVDKDANLDMAVRVVVDAKTQYPSVCNAAETLLLHEDLISNDSAIGRICTALFEKKVKLRACAKSYPVILKQCPAHFSSMVSPATEDDFFTEFLCLEMAVKIVSDVRGAIKHINEHGSHHTDAIVTDNTTTAELFLQQVDSAGVYHNASTRFADGFRYGFGAEVGVSTNRIHARGPVGLDGLLSYKYRLHGQGQIVDSYGSKAGKKEFLHQPILGVETISLSAKKTKKMITSLQSTTTVMFFVGLCCGVVLCALLGKPSR